MPKATIPPAVREAVRSRASNGCEYCQSQDKYSPTAFTIDHILPQSLAGTSDIDNFTYACFLCNRLKSNKRTSFDAITETWVPLFMPRQHTWSDHFAWSDNATLIVGLTAIGRCTVKELRLNREKLVDYRQTLILFGVHPPDAIGNGDAQNE